MIKKKSVAILIDGSNLHAACRALGFNMDYKRLLAMFDDCIFKSYYFTALPPDTEQSTLRPMVDYLEFNGFTVIKKNWKEFNQSSTFTCRECSALNVFNSIKNKGNMDIEIAVVALEVAPYVTDVFFFSGDGDFRFLVESLQRRYGIFVTVFSTIKSNPVMCADALRRQADAFIDLADIRSQIERVDERPRGFHRGASHV